MFLPETFRNKVEEIWSNNQKEFLKIEAPYTPPYAFSNLSLILPLHNFFHFAANELCKVHFNQIQSSQFRPGGVHLHILTLKF